MARNHVFRILTRVLGIAASCVLLWLYLWGAFDNAHAAPGNFFPTIGGSGSKILLVDPSFGPYRTITAARNAASPGNTIVVNPGTYAENNLLTNGVNYWFHPGTLVYANYATTNSATDWGIWDDRPTGPTTNTIGGYGIFQTMTYTDIVNASSQLVNSNALGTIVVTNPSSYIVIGCKEIQASRWLSSTLLGFCVYVVNGYLKLDCEKMWDPFPLNSVAFTNFNVPHNFTRTSHAGGLYWEQGSHYVKCSQNLPSPSCPYGIWGNGLTVNDTGDLWYDGDFMSGKIYTSFTSTNSRDWIHIRTIEINTNTSGGASTVAASYYGSGKHYLICDKIAGSAFAAAGSETVDTFLNNGVSNQTVWINAQKLSSSNLYFNVQSGTVNAAVFQLEDLGFAAQNGGTTLAGNGVLNLTVDQGGIVTVTTTATVTYNQGWVRADTTSAGFTVSLPAIPFHGERHKVKKISADGNTLTVSGNGHNIDGSATKTTTTQYAGFIVVYDAVTATWNLE
jgi:hypothetical protein